MNIIRVIFLRAVEIQWHFSFLWRRGKHTGLQSLYYIHFRTNTLGKIMISLTLQAMCQIVPLSSFYKNIFDIK